MTAGRSNAPVPDGHEARRIVRDGYDALAGRYLAARSRDGEDMALLRDLLRRLPEGARVLDAGCGAGVPVAEVLALRTRVVGIDFSMAQLAMARRLVPAARFLCMDMSAMGFQPASFDAIVSFYAIIHVPREQHRALFGEFARLLTPGGLALLCLGSDDLPADMDEFLGTPMFWSHFNAESNLRLLRECGFGVVATTTVQDRVPGGGEHLFVLARREPEEAG